MTEPVTEVALIPLQSGATVEDADSTAGEIWRETLDTIKAQKGFQKCYYGREIENTNNLHFFVDWDSITDHQNFTKSPTYPSFSKNILPIVDGSISLLHAHLEPHPPSAAVSSTTSPVTEILTAYLPTASPIYKTHATTALSSIHRHAKSCTATASGWIVEDIRDSNYFEEGKKGKIYVSCIGWQSVEAHMKFRETREFEKEVGPMLREGTVGLRAVHARFVEG